ncbi:MAG: hypothetical protein C4315_02390 [Chloroflexota bacterium]
MSALRVDIRVPVGRPIPELVGFIRRVEAAGLTGVGVHDHHHSGRDAYVTLALAAAQTRRLSLYPATSNPLTRHPLVLAALGNSLAELAPGRTMLTLGPGLLSVEAAGLGRARREVLRRAVRQIKALLGGEAVAFNGTPTRLRYPAGVRVPVLLLASGPRLIELAGEVADGVMMLVGLNQASVAAARAHLAAGARRAGRDPDELLEILIVPIALGDREEVRRWPRGWFRSGQPWLAYPSRSNLYWLRLAGIDLPDDFEPEKLSDGEADRVCEALGLFGPPEYCAERLIRAQAELGVNRVFLFPAHSVADAYDLPEAEVAVFERIIGPRLGL